jgi:hypothetical protein
MPWPIEEDWNHIETIHPLVLELSYADGTQDAKNDWRKAMKEIPKTPAVERLTPVHAKIHLIHDIGGLALPARALLTSVILPSYKLLDNFDLEGMRTAVAHTRGRALLEASGGIQIESIRDVAATGVDRISIGQLTKNIRAIDYSLRVTARSGERMVG